MITRLEISAARADDHELFPYKGVQPFIMHVEGVPHGQEAKNKQNRREWRMELHDSNYSTFGKTG